MSEKQRLKLEDRRLKVWTPRCLLSSHFSLLTSLRAFSLVEMMIAIVILGLGLVMVATIFPVAWDRARTLSDYTVEQAASSGAHATLQTLLRPAGHGPVEILPHPAPGLPLEELRLTAGSLAGDMFYDPTLPPRADRGYRHLAILAYSDTSVHALNVENMLAKPDRTIADNRWGLVLENPWNLEDPGNPPGTLTQIVQNKFLDVNYPNLYPRNRGASFPDRLFYGGDRCLTPQGGTPQARVWQRLYPPMEAPPADPAALDQWNEKLATRRFCWAVLHRLRTRVGPERPTAPPDQPKSDQLVREAAAAMGSTRTFDMYYVTLRRSKSTNRYARQDPNPAKIPNPFLFDRAVAPVNPAVMESKNDVMFPVAWRVQMPFTMGATPKDNATGIPSETQFPFNAVTGEPARMLVQMFPPGTQFIDEITGSVYRVAKRRIVDDKGEQSVLTLDREVFLEDLDLPPGDPRCDPVVCRPGSLEDEERLRTVWVFPPPVDRTQPGGEQTPTPTFDGPSPVVNIEVATLSISPSS